MKYYLIAGEASGDLHGSNLVKSLLQKDENAAFRGWGGDRMRNEGVELVKHISELAFMGFTEVLLNLRTILGNISLCKKDIEAFEPDVLILIDYPGFNMRIGSWAKKRGIKVVYYIAPQIWAWKKQRVHKIAAMSDEVCVVLPFEKDFFKGFGYDVTYVGHPILDAIEQRNPPTFEVFGEMHGFSGKPIVALIPGSRKQEIHNILPNMIAIAKEYRDQYQFVIAGAPAIEEAFYKSFIGSSGVDILHGKTYDLLEQSHAALVGSGTATLETALFKVPQVVCYKGSAISVFIAKKLVDIKYISLVNLILDKEAVTELIQETYQLKNLKEEFEGIASNSSERRKEILHDYHQLISALGEKGASERTAIQVLKTLQQPLS